MKTNLLLALMLLTGLTTWGQELIKNGDFKLPDDGKIYGTIDSIPNWRTDDHRVGCNVRDIFNGDAVCNQWDGAGSFYQVVGVVPAEKTTFQVSYKITCTYSYWAGWKAPVYIIFSSFSGDDPLTRTPIDSLEYEFWTDSKNYGKDSLINLTWTLDSGSQAAGKNLAIEFKQFRSADYGYDESWTYLNYDDISVVATGGKVIVDNGGTGTELLTNGDFSLPNDSVEHKNISTIPGWKTDTNSADVSGRANVNTGPRTKEAVCWLWDETPGIYQVIGTVPATATQYNVSFDLSCFYTWWGDYKSDFYVIFSSYSGDDATKRLPLDSIKFVYDCVGSNWFNFSTLTGSFVVEAGSPHAGENLVAEFKPYNSADFMSGSSYTYFWMDNCSVKSSVYTAAQVIKNVPADRLKIIVYDHTLRVDGASLVKSVAVYDLTGRKVFQVRPSNYLIQVPQLSGFHIVRVETDLGVKTQKVVF